MLFALIDIPMPSALAFLTGSETRIAVLVSLSNAPMDRAALQAECDVSRTTLWRVLHQLKEYGFVRESGTQLSLTTRGTLVAESLRQFRATVVATERLEGLLEHLPTEAFSFDVSRLADAEVTRPVPHDPQAPLRAAAATVPGSTRIRSLSHSWARPVLEKIYEETRTGDCTVEMVLTTDVVEQMKRDAQAAANAVEMAEAGVIEILAVSHPVDHVLGICDDEVNLGVADSTGRPLALLATTDEAVHDWAVETYEEHRRQATPVDIAQFE